ncbi:light-inducible protein CPRF3-like isoform X2 [Daucus carota subsp. sativus]|uniref:light-inducible protein CPRF3-like isoform X2 n=1 Tax=Daucus carota subsp. sativus TaxID=79200 RepID=UPI0030835544
MSDGEEGTLMRHSKPASLVQEVSKVTAPGPDRLSSVQYHAPFPSGGILAHPTMPSESAAGKDRNVHQMLEEGPGDTISAAGSNRSDSVAPGVVAVQVKPDQRYEYEELQHRVHALNNENRFLKEELQKVSEECNKVTSENDSIKAQLLKICGQKNYPCSN